MKLKILKILKISDQMLYLDATELVENPGRALRRVAKFMEVPAVIDENNFYFDEEKGFSFLFFRLILEFLLFSIYRVLLYETAS